MNFEDKAEDSTKKPIENLDSSMLYLIKQVAILKA